VHRRGAPAPAIEAARVDVVADGVAQFATRDPGRAGVVDEPKQAVGQRVTDASAPYDLRGSFVSLLVWEGRTMLEVAGQAGHGVDVCELYYARIFEGYDPAERTSAEQAIRAARQLEGRAMDAIRGETPSGATR
jgi:hypothetical protein